VLRQKTSECVRGRAQAGSIDCSKISFVQKKQYQQVSEKLKTFASWPKYFVKYMFGRRNYYTTTSICFSVRKITATEPFDLASFLRAGWW
jgi:hypothetical protein